VPVAAANLSQVDLALDMYETADAVVVEMAVPGIDPKDLEVKVQDNRLTVQGEIKSDEKHENKDYVLQERRYGRFFRSVSLPEHVKGSEAQAEFENGVLKLSIPKREEAKPTTVKVAAK
jgi:HSP20 family protein